MRASRRPTEGDADLYGRVGSLLEVGTGFHPELTGRENIYLNGAILGMRRAEIARKFDAIVDFSGVARFLDTPVKRYSSGMYVRLAFAVAAHLETEILLVDEVLAVGDAEFQRKCLDKMQTVVREGRTVLFVSHNMAAVKSLCQRAVLLDGGRVRRDGPVDEVVDAYLSSATPIAEDGRISDDAPRAGSGGARFRRVMVSAGDGRHGTGDLPGRTAPPCPRARCGQRRFRTPSSRLVCRRSMARVWPRCSPWTRDDTPTGADARPVVDPVGRHRNAVAARCTRSTWACIAPATARR